MGIGVGLGELCSISCVPRAGAQVPVGCLQLSQLPRGPDGGQWARGRGDQAGLEASPDGLAGWPRGERTSPA